MPKAPRHRMSRISGYTQIIDGIFVSVEERAVEKNGKKIRLHHQSNVIDGAALKELLFILLVGHKRMHT